MRLPVRCTECYPLGDYRRRAENEKASRLRLELRDDNAYVATCPNDHEVRVSLMNLRYELLFESGIVALLYRFNRESVASIASALERFCEFGIRVLLRHDGVSPEQVEAAWQFVENDSQRQLYAFAMMYLAAFKRPFVPPKQFETMASFRNGVIHKGKMPTAAKAMEYARWVFDLVWAVYAELERLDEKAVDAITKELGVRAAQTKLGPPKPGKDGKRRTTMAKFPTMLTPGAPPRDFDRRLADTKKRLDVWGLPPLGAI